MPAAPPTASDAERLLARLETMLLIRRFEEKAGQLYGMGLIGGFCHLYIGQEAVVTGLAAECGPADRVITSYRCHGHALAWGLDPAAVMAELTGRASGVCGGMGGSMHLCGPAHGFFGGQGIVGAQVPIGAGLAFASRYRGDGGVALTCFGDGAANQGQVYETFNMAALWHLPAVFVIENNRYALGTSMARSTSTPELHTRGAAFAIPGEAVDGMDVEAVEAAAARAIGHARAGNGPYILEMQTERYRGHSVAEPAKYGSRDEGAKAREARDPIERLRLALVERGLADEGRLREIDRAVRARVAEAAETAQAAPEPGPDAFEATGLAHAL